MKWLFVLLLCFLTITAPMELSRLILIYGLEFTTTFELCWLWLSYLVFLIIIAKVVKVRND